MYSVRPEISKCKGLRGIAFQRLTACIGTSEIGLNLVKSKVRPAGKESEPTKNCCNAGVENESRDSIGNQVDCRKVLDSYLCDAFE